MKKKIIFSLFLGVLLLSSLSAMSVSFYYSENCNYCKQIYPFVIEQIRIYPSYNFGLYDVSSNEENYQTYTENNFGGVPSFLIKTDDCREIKFVGADERRLKCELQQMSSIECMTYLDGEGKRGGSWFVE